MKKILFVDHTAVMGGAELSLLDLAIAYAESSKVLLLEDGVLRERLAKSQVRVEVLEASADLLGLRTSSGWRSLQIIPELWRLAGEIARRGEDYELILANSQKAFIVTALAALRGSTPICWYLHDILTAQHFSRVNRQVAVFLANRFARRVLVNSQATARAFVAAGGRQELCHVVYNGFEPEKFAAVSDDRTSKIRSELKIGDRTLVGLFSRLSYWKGQHVLLAAVRELPQVQVILVGKALFGEEEYVSQLEELAAVPELEGRVHWLGFRDDIPALMKACDLVVHTSTEPEPFGRVIVEGQLAQKPVIASAAGGALELIESGVNGYLFPPGDVIALGELISRLASDRPLAQTIATAGYHHARDNFALETILASFESGISF
ncbi:MAG: glycosyltransferase [Cyanobacteria bacterium J06623_7]